MDGSHAEVWDICSDGYMFVVVMGTGNLSHSTYILWVCFFSLACFVSLVVLTIKARVYLELFFRRRRLDFRTSSNLVVAGVYAEKHAERYAEARHVMLLTYAVGIQGLLEDLPMGILGLLYIRHISEDRAFSGLQTLQLLSIASSFVGLGMKINRIPRLR